MVQQKQNAAQQAMHEKWLASKEAEQTILSSLLYSPYSITKVVDLLQPDHFNTDAHQVIYRAMVKVYQQGRTASMENVLDELDRRNELEQIGGLPFLSDLANNFSALQDINDAAEIVIRKATMRRLQYASQQIAELAFHEDEDAVARAEQLIYEITIGAQIKQTITFSDAIDEYLEELAQRREDLKNNTGRGLPTGFPEIDRMMGGLQPGTLTTIGALTGYGKSAFALNVALNIVTNTNGTKKKVLFNTLEMRHGEIVERALSMQAQIDGTLLRDGTVDDTDMRAIKARAMAMKQCQLFLDDRSFSIDDICSNAKRLHAHQKLDLIVVDYLQLIEAVNKNNKNGTRAQEIAEMSRRLKRLAQELNIPVVALVQLNRQLEKQQEQDPNLSDINESGGIARDSDTVMFLYTTKEEIEKRNRSETFTIFVKVAKCRRGRLGTESLFFAPRITSFRPATFTPEGE